MKVAHYVVGMLVVVAVGAQAAPDKRYCEMVASLAKGITEDRDKGVSYNAQLGKLKGASEGVPSAAGILVVSKAILQTVYLDMPKITPEGAYKLHYVACMTAK